MGPSTSFTLGLRAGEGLSRAELLGRGCWRNVRPQRRSRREDPMGKYKPPLPASRPLRRIGPLIAIGAFGAGLACAAQFIAVSVPSLPADDKATVAGVATSEIGRASGRA